MVKLYLFNQFRLLENGREIDNFRSQKVKALLVYLVLTDEQPIARSELQALLWSDYMPQSAQASLRVTLSNIRQLFSHIDGLLVIERYTVYFNRSHPAFWCDLLDEETRPAGQPLLPDLHHIGSPRFQEWLETQQSVHIAQPRKTERKTNIPRALTPLFGRENEIEQLTGRILAGDTPLITIAGVGGVGKTQLALAIGRFLQDHFTDGIWFVPLTTYVATDDIGQIVAANMLELLQNAPVNQLDARQQLFAFLQARHLLLILDNIEQLVQKPQFAEFLLQLLDSAPNVHLLATSRRRLAISAEWCHDLKQLAVPDEANLPLSQLRQFSSIQLFAEKAQRVWTTFALTASNGAAITEICRMVGGLPLGIELAAAQIVRRDSAEIVTLLSRSLARLHNPEHNARHASLQTVFDHSWVLLSADLQQILVACALFQGDFSLQSARAVTGGSAEQIHYLVQHSLIQQVAPARFDLHPIIAEFAMQKLVASRGRSAIEHKFLTHYLDCVAQQKVPLYKLTTRTPIERLQRELKHIQLAWQLAIDQQHFPPLAAAIKPLYRFYMNAFGQYNAFIRLVEQIEHSPAPDDLRLTAAILKAYPLVLTGDVQLGFDIIRDAANRATTPTHFALAYEIWGLILAYEGNAAAAQPLFAQAWQYAQADSDPILQHERVTILRLLIHATRKVGQTQLADELLQKGLTLAVTGAYRYDEIAMRYDIARDHQANYRYDRVIAVATPLISQAYALQLVQSEVNILSMLAYCHRVQGEYDRAVELVTRAKARLKANPLGIGYDLYMCQHDIMDLLRRGELDEAHKHSLQLLKQAESVVGYVWEVVYLYTLRVQFARKDINTARMLIDQLRDRSPQGPHNQLLYHDAEVNFGLLTDTLSLEIVEQLLALVTTYAGYIPLELYKSVTDGFTHLQDERATTCAQLVHDSLDQRAAGIADPTYREKYLTHQRQLLSLHPH